MRSPCHGAWILGLCSLVGSSLSAQDPTVAEPQQPPSLALDTTSVSSGFVALHDVDGTLWGAGDDYKVRFADDVTFFPMLGSAAPRNMPVRLELTSIGRARGVTIPAAELGTPKLGHSGFRAAYERGFVTERYDVRADAVEQSFLFDRLPEGEGDLVVRLRLDTELHPEGDGKTLDLHYGSAGSVAFGAVTGIDANGARAAGSLRYADGTIELALPAEFVDGAALPLVLDPTIGSTIQVSNDLSVNDEQNPDISADRTTGFYLCVWERVFSASDYDIVGRRISSSGTLTGGFLLLESDGNVNARDGRVANQNLNDMFVVVWEQTDDIHGRAVRASDGAIGALRSIATGSDVQQDPELASDSSLVDDDVIIVWENVTQTTVQARQLHADETTLALSVVGLVTTVATADANWDDYDPDIARCGGEDGTYLIVWRRFFPGSSSQEIRGRLFTRDLAPIGSSPYFVITNDSVNDFDPDCDGDGRQWVVVYEKVEANGSDTGIYCQTIVRNPASTTTGVLLLSGEQPVQDNIGDDENNPEVTWLGDSALVVWSDEAGSPNYDLYSRSIDPFECNTCESVPSIVIDAAVLEDRGAIASRFSAGAATPGGSYLKNDAFIVWSARELPSPFRDEIRGLRYTATDGNAADLGGGCGLGGESFATCSFSPNSGFAPRILRAEASANAFLLLSPSSFAFNCGPCKLIADPFFGFVLPGGVTDVAGNAEVNIPIPSSPALDGLTLYAQWAISATTPTCTAVGVDLSNALLIQIEQ